MKIEFKIEDGVRYYRLGPRDRWKEDNLTEEDLQRMECPATPRAAPKVTLKASQRTPQRIAQRQEEQSLTSIFLKDLPCLFINLIIRYMIVLLIAGIIYAKTVVPEGENPITYFVQEYLEE